MIDTPINDHHFAQRIASGSLSGSKCGDCGKLFVPPRPVCECGSTQLDWEEVSGNGKLVAFTCIAIGPPSMNEYGFDRDNPYVSAVIELTEGPRVVARLDGVDAQTPGSIQIGLNVKVDFEASRPDGGLVFRPM